ncbi:hypothetical protein ACS0TY_017078 [Phlomoides rotata]
MADNEEGDQNIPRGNEWEVVSMTGSAYTAVPGSDQVDSSHDSHGELGGEDEAEASSPMIMSGHFVFPPSQHENLPLEPEYNQINDDRGSDFDVSQLVEKEDDILDVNDEENVSSKDMTSDEFPGIVMFDEKGNKLSASNTEKSISSTAEFSSSDLEATMDKSNTVEEDEGTDDISLPQHHTSDSGSLDSEKTVKAGKRDGGDLPCEAWWKRRAITLYAQAKEANTFWSVCIAATVMGLVIIGHQWQQERWQVLHLRWLSISDQRMGRILGPIARVKDVIVNGHRRGSLIRGSTSSTEL